MPSPHGSWALRRRLAPGHHATAAAAAAAAGAAASTRLPACDASAAQSQSQSQRSRPPRPLACVVDTRVDASGPTPHVVYTVALRGLTSTGGEDLTIETCWSAVRQLDRDLTRNGMWWPAGYTKAVASLAPARSFGWGSATDAETTQARAPVVARFLSALLAEPQLRAHPKVVSFLDEGRWRRLQEEDRQRRQEEAKQAAARRQEQDRRLVELRPRTLALLQDTGLLAPFLGTQDIHAASLCCREWRGFVGQVWSLRPTPAWELPPLKPAAASAGSGQASSLIGQQQGQQQAQRMQEDEQDDGRWDIFLAALEAGKMPRLRQLDFRTYSEGLTPPQLSCAQIKQLANALYRVPHLTDLDLQGCCMSSRSVETLVQGLRHTPKLRTLDVFANRIDDVAAKALASVLPQLPELQLLCASSLVRVSGAGLTAIAEQLHHLPELVDLVLPYCNEAGAVGSVTKQLQHLPRLRRLCLNGTNIQDDDAIELARVLQRRQLPEVRAMMLSANYITKHGIRAIGQALQHIPQLNVLSIRDNAFDRAAYDELKAKAAAIGLVLERQWSEKTNCYTENTNAPISLLRQGKDTTPWGRFHLPLRLRLEDRQNMFWF